ncbi:MAG TPA: J domain-containing protein [Terriglobales bacterium]|nr:J domain-containing protein [Terriglobales bacterium]
MSESAAHPDEIAQCRQLLQVLDVAPGADLAKLETAYRVLTKIWSPEAFEFDPERRQFAARKLDQINAAYEWLRQHPKALEVVASTDGIVSENEAVTYRWDASWRRASAVRIAIGKVLLVIMLVSTVGLAILLLVVPPTIHVLHGTVLSIGDADATDPDKPREITVQLSERPEQKLVTVYRGRAQLRVGQTVEVQEAITPVFGGKRYRVTEYYPPR